MKNRIRNLFVALALLALTTLNSQLSTCFAQGSLTPPPGAPAPTMLALNQIEPRTPISSAPFTITQPGSYYLTANLTVAAGDAIDISANGVTLDLNGFTISSTDPANTGSGIKLIGMPAATDITILNGHITGGVTYNGGTGTFAGPGFLNGISSGEPALLYNARVSGVSVSGCLNNGISLGNGGSTTVVDSCTVQTVGGQGIWAGTVTRSAAVQCGNSAINANIVSDCYGYSIGSDGIAASETANNCSGYSQSSYGAGLYANTANNCYGYSYGNNGIGVSAVSANNCYGDNFGFGGTGTGLYATTATGCYGTSYSGPGVDANIANNCYGESYGSGYGVDANNANNCYGSSSTGGGLFAVTANSCYCYSTGGDGLDADNATGCYAYSTSGNGISVPFGIANNCYASSSTGTGLNASGGIAIGCFAFSGSGAALSANIANSCYSSTGDGSITHAYNMP
jgi:hypothetical protein